MPTDLGKPSSEQERFIATSVEEALAYLAAHQGKARVTADGVPPALRTFNGRLPSCAMVDVAHIASMRRIGIHNGHLVLGGAVSFATLEQEPLVREHLPLLAAAAAQAARKTTTLAGCIMAAEGNSVGAVALLALEAEVEITNLTGAQWLPVGTLWVHRGAPRVDNTAEIITAVRAPLLRPGQGQGVAALPAGAAEEPPLLVLALNLVLGAGEQAPARVRVAWGTNEGIPARLPALEELLLGLNPADPAAQHEFAVTFGDTVMGSCRIAGTAQGLTREAATALAQDVLVKALNMALRPPAGAR